MTRQGSSGFACAALIVGSLWLTGCAAIADLEPSADPLAARLADQLDRDGWRFEPPETRRNGFRWQFEAEGLAVGDRPDEPLSPDVGWALRTLADRSDRVAWNALILLGRLDPDESVANRIGQIVRGERQDPSRKVIAFQSWTANGDDTAAELPLTTRAAAAEAWCHALAASDAAIETALAEPGELWRDEELPVLVRSELLCGIARHVSPERIVGYADLFPGDAATVPVELRRAAIAGCILWASRSPQKYEPGDWPGTIENCRNDPDSLIRQAYGHWLAVARHPEAADRLMGQLQDSDAKVAEPAIRSLGDLKTDDAYAALQLVAEKPAETLRSAAAAALARWGPKEVKRFLNDESSHVRRAAVSALAAWPGPAAAVLLDEAFADPDLDVQRRAIAATDVWDDEFAIPVLLSALQNAAVRTRRDALDALRRRANFDEALSVTGDREERIAAVRSLAAQHGWPIDALTEFRLATAGSAAPATPESSDVTALLDSLSNASQNALEQEEVCVKLKAVGPGAVPTIETFCLEHPGAIANMLITDVLPTISDAHASVSEMKSADVTIRRRAAGRLAELGRSATLRPLVLKRLHDVLAREQDGLVWRQAMAAIAADATPEAEGIVLLAVNNTWPDVRRLGCEHIARHGRSHQAVWLLPLLSDDSDAVRLAAIDAIGRCGSAVAIGGQSSDTTSHPGLKAAAVDPNRDIRLAALTALARLGDESGSVALLHWAEHEAALERVKAIRAIASTGRRRFERDLERLAWTERDPNVRRELIAALGELVPAGQRPEWLTGPSE